MSHFIVVTKTVIHHICIVLLDFVTSLSIKPSSCFRYSPGKKMAKTLMIHVVEKHVDHLRCCLISLVRHVYIIMFYCYLLMNSEMNWWPLGYQSHAQQTELSGYYNTGLKHTRTKCTTNKIYLVLFYHNFRW